MAEKRAMDAAFDVNVQGNDGTPWGVYAPDEGGVHVIPEYGPEHDQVATCWCHPSIELEYDEPLIVHNVAH